MQDRFRYLPGNENSNAKELINDDDDSSDEEGPFPNEGAFNVEDKVYDLNEVYKMIAKGIRLRAVDILSCDDFDDYDSDYEEPEYYLPQFKKKKICTKQTLGEEAK